MSTECDVCLAGFDGIAEFFGKKERTARKPYKCYDCRAAIPIGTTYAHVGGKCEGELWSARVCLFCEEINTVFSCGQGVEYGNLWENMEDCVFPNLKVSSPCFTKLKPETRRFLIERWWNWKERNSEK